MTSPFSHEPRRRPSGQKMARIFAACDGRCRGPCKRKLRPGEDWDADHIIALENGGTNDIDNFQILCAGCHALKTKADHAAAERQRLDGLRLQHAPQELPGPLVLDLLRRSRSWNRRA